jgi:hypothetical protein
VEHVICHHQDWDNRPILAVPSSGRYKRDEFFGKQPQDHAHNEPYICREGVYSNATMPNIKTTLSTMTSSHDRAVRFGHLRIITFALSIGDNPSCSDGIPVAMIGEPLQTKIQAIETFEQTRLPRRTRKGLLMSKEVREEM